MYIMINKYEIKLSGYIHFQAKGEKFTLIMKFFLQILDYHDPLCDLQGNLEFDIFFCLNLKKT